MLQHRAQSDWWRVIHNNAESWHEGVNLYLGGRCRARGGFAQSTAASLPPKPVAGEIRPRGRPPFIRAGSP